ncbi:DUF5753 domain-containing protein [Streptomyces sp. NPDC088915]|uniref:DUF5753 domain-containing protein n=1 Tax=Streptomyces sp. NPDC088915 TaxID=3365912 RepID=UPI0037FCB29F
MTQTRTRPAPAAKNKRPPTTRATPTVMRRRVGSQMRRWRGPMPSGVAAKLMGWDSVKLGRIERGLYKISADEVREYAGLLGITDTRAIEAVAEAAEEPLAASNGAWWKAYDGRVSSSLLDFVQLEARAKEVKTHHPVVIPGALQSPGYAREIIAASPRTEELAKTVELRINMRLARQEILTRTDDPVDFHALVPESAFHARFRDPTIMRDQLRKLIDVSKQPNVTLQIVPLTAHPFYGSDGPATILGFDYPWVKVGSIDNSFGGSHTEDPDEVAFLETGFEQIASIALPVDRSRDLLIQHLEGSNK